MPLKHSIPEKKSPSLLFISFVILGLVAMSAFLFGPAIKYSISWLILFVLGGLTFEFSFVWNLSCLDYLLICPFFLPMSTVSQLSLISCNLIQSDITRSAGLFLGTSKKLKHSLTLLWIIPRLHMLNQGIHEMYVCSTTFLFMYLFSSSTVFFG